TGPTHIRRRSRDNGGVKPDNPRGKHRKGRMPPWLVGLILAVILFVIVLVTANFLGFGDDPVVGGLGSIG
ncbi:MAG TPA: hypothetical protein VJ398_10355, partial [Acidimicrobiia bacterium]|nr:hypothetical protein [Acidimicrobiia bacterium]